MLLFWYYSNIIMDMSLLFYHCLLNIYVFHIILYLKYCNGMRGWDIVEKKDFEL
jgi:hypothetical protein